VAVQRRESGLLVASPGWTPNGVNFLRYRRKVRTVTLASGERAKVVTDDSGTVTHIETANRMDAVVRPKTVRLRFPIR
jgi:hypothetical protein